MHTRKVIIAYTGRRWTDLETDLMLRGLELGCTHRAIGRTIARSANGVRHRVAKIRKAVVKTRTFQDLLAVARATSRR